MIKSILMVLLLIPIVAHAQNEPDTTWYQPDSLESVREHNNNSHQIRTKVGKRNGINNSFFELVNWPDEGADSTYFGVDIGANPNTTEFKGDTTVINYPSFQARFYFKDQNFTMFEWEVILYAKPPGQANWSFPYSSENLDFHYQDSTDWDELTDYRPDSVWFSYAVYHSSKSNNQFGTGKAFHIYRPKAWDSSNPPDTLWLDLMIDTEDNTISISGDNTWFRDAVYPVVIDPTLGFTTEGGSTKSLNGRARGSWFVASEAGTIDSFYIFETDNQSLGAGAYTNDNGNLIPDLCADSSTIAVTGTQGGEWLAFLSAENYQFSSGDTLWLMGVGDGEESIPIMLYDTVAGKGYYASDLFPPACPFSGIGATNRHYSIYAVYTATGGTPGTNYRRRIEQQRILFGR